MQIERTNNEIIIRLPSNVNPEGLQQLVDYLVYEEATADSLAQQSEIDALAKEVKRGWWNRNKDRVMK